MIKLNHLIAGYTPGIDILKGISLHVRKAEIVTLLGPNGCGKSTLLKCIAGYLTPRSGQIEIQSHEVGQIPIHRKVRECGLGFVPQTDNVFTQLTIKENLLTGGQFLSRNDCKQRIDELCDRYPLLRKKWLDRASSMSGGERQILALTRALMARPQVLLLDEPSAGLSPKMLEDVFEAILNIRKQENVTILMVEQNAIEALHISDRAYVLAMGKVALSGHAKELLDDPRMRELYLGGRAA
ncbi:MAG: High-affinity branched-chain amino acid transport ATP-binding protein LivF [Candidatus Celerinatantimonas neptuna]|nr:MAG: High-affinity branched-chain amino acid transport ATP-binding protein LivF [Candidatus Celerinatantimonas neptuna]